jgi:hypothetical protein
MGRSFARVLILLTIALALANGQCFARCLAQPVDNARVPRPCHSQGRPHVDARQHDLELTATHSTAPSDWNSLAWIDQPMEPARTLAQLMCARRDRLPHPFDNAYTPLPLRI